MTSQIFEKTKQQKTIRSELTFQLRLFFIPYTLFRFFYGRNLVTDTMIGAIFHVDRLKNKLATTIIVS